MSIASDQHPVWVGDRTTATALARLLEFYPMVLIPFGENQRYDLLIDSGGEYIRVQCKTGRLRSGAIRFNCCSVTYHHPTRKKSSQYRQDYKEAADVFGVYCPDTDRVYIVPVTEVGTNAAALRVEPTKNSQRKRVRWAADFELNAGLAQLGRASLL